MLSPVASWTFVRLLVAICEVSRLNSSSHMLLNIEPPAEALCSAAYDFPPSTKATFWAHGAVVAAHVRERLKLPSLAAGCKVLSIISPQFLWCVEKEDTGTPNS